MNIIKEKEVDIKSITQTLKEGETLVYPTETCYGLGCDATNQAAVDKVFEIKHRQKNKAVLVIVPSVEMIRRYVEWSPKLQEISDLYWPGPLTVVSFAKESDILPKGVVSDDGTIAFRVTAHPLSAQLSELLDAPLVSTSANLASEKSPYDIKEVCSMFDGSEPKPDIVIDGGALPDHSPSTVVRVQGENLEVLRQGEIVVK